MTDVQASVAALLSGHFEKAADLADGISPKDMPAAERWRALDRAREIRRVYLAAGYDPAILPVRTVGGKAIK